MDLAAFDEFHRPALAADEVRHNVLLSVLNRALSDPDCEVRLWSLGPPGVCAAQQSGYGVLLGNVSQTEAEQLASDVRDLNIPSVMGTDEAADWFVAASKPLGIDFPHLMDQTIYILDTSPSAPDVPGAARLATADDTQCVLDWFAAFRQEAVPDDPAPTRKEVETRIRNKRVTLWCVDDRPVSMCCVGRVLEKGVAIAPVYTPPQDRCNGYAAAATAATVDQVLERGYQLAYLYTDNTNPASNRCYQNIGFKPYCRSRHYRRG